MMDVLAYQDKEKAKDKYSGVVMIEFPRKGQYALALVTGVTPRRIQGISPTASSMCTCRLRRIRPPATCCLCRSAN